MLSQDKRKFFYLPFFIFTILLLIGCKSDEDLKWLKDQKVLTQAAKNALSYVKFHDGTLFNKNNIDRDFILPSSGPERIKYTWYLYHPEDYVLHMGHKFKDNPYYKDKYEKRIAPSKGCTNCSTFPAEAIIMQKGLGETSGLCSVLSLDISSIGTKEIIVVLAEMEGYAGAVIESFDVTLTKKATAGEQGFNVEEMKKTWKESFEKQQP